MKNLRHYCMNEKGGVSIFIVIFTALLVTVVTASFAQIMVRSQQRAIANDLSQSAYDSAMAGVEDAKRAIVRLQECDNKGDACANTIRTALESGHCDSLQNAGVTEFGAKREVQVGEESQNQAYTCVKVQLETPNYLGEGIGAGQPVVIPLKGKTAFTKIRISWFSAQDLKKITEDKADPVAVTVPTIPTDASQLLPLQENWTGFPEYSPALLRAQLIQFNKGNLSLNEFNKQGSKNARTLFLYPLNAGGNLTDFSLDSRRSGAGSVNNSKATQCNSEFTTYSGYACRMDITLPDPEGAGPSQREAYLQLQSYYQSVTSYKVELFNGANLVNLNEVQPQVDSTGRASSLFRRVRANISIRNNGEPPVYPDAALSVGGTGICKNFFVTDDPNESSVRSDQGCLAP